MSARILPFQSRRPDDNLSRNRRRLAATSLERLALYLNLLKTKETAMHKTTYDAPAGQPTMVITRTFDAPRRLVWKALAEPEHVIRWFGPHRHTNRVVEFDWRVGGKWKIETTTPEGQKILFFGEYREIVAPERVTQTFAFDALPDGVYSLETVELEEVDGRTIYRGSSVFPDVASRDGMLASGMETGVEQGFERLDAMLEEFKQTA